MKLYDSTILTKMLLYPHPQLPNSRSLFTLVDICAAVAEGAWKDTADCRGRQVGVRHAEVWGSQVLWSVMLCPPQLMIKHEPNCRWWPWLPARPNAQPWTPVSAEMTHIKAMPARKKQLPLAPQQQLNNVSSIIYKVLGLLSLTLSCHI